MVGWAGAMNDPDLPPPWWCGAPYPLRRPGPLAETPLVEEPGLADWLTIVLRSMTTVEEWHGPLSRRGAEPVCLWLVHAEQTKAAGRVRKTQDGGAEYDIGVPPEIAHSTDLGVVSRWLLEACLAGLQRVGVALDLDGPSLRTVGRREPSLVGSGPRLARMCDGVVLDPRGAVVVRSRGSGNGASTWPELAALGVGGWEAGGYEAFVIGDPGGGGVPDEGVGPVPFDFTAISYPIFVEELVARPHTQLVVVRPVGAGESLREARGVLQAQVSRAGAAAGLRARSAGRDGDVLWVVLARVRSTGRAAGDVAQRPEGDNPMTEDEFWTIIDSARSEAGSGWYGQIDALRDALASRSTAEIAGFIEHFGGAHDRLNCLDVVVATELAGIAGGEDQFTDILSFVVAHGRAVFERVRVDPDALAELKWDPNSLDEFAAAEEFASVAYELYEAAGGQAELRYLEERAEPSGEEPDRAETALRIRFPRLSSRAHGRK